MTEERFLKNFENALLNSISVNRLRSPYDTGNLRYNAIKIIETDRGYKLFVDLSAAHYAQYLDNFGSIKARYPEGWWDHICLNIIQDLLNKYDGVVIEDEEDENADTRQTLAKWTRMRKYSGANAALTGGATHGKSAKSNPKYVLGSYLYKDKKNTKKIYDKEKHGYKTRSVGGVKRNVSRHQKYLAASKPNLMRANTDLNSIHFSE